MAGEYRDSGWKGRNSLHLLLFLFPMFFPWPFIIMAGKVESKKFKRLGLAYFLAGVLLFLVELLAMSADSEGVGIATIFIGILIHFFAFAQCCLYMGEYHRLLAEREDMLRLGGNPYNMYGQNFGGYNQPRIPMDNRSVMNMPQQFGQPSPQVDLAKRSMVNYGSQAMQSSQMGMQNPQMGMRQNPQMGMQQNPQMDMQSGYGAAPVSGGLHGGAPMSVNSMQSPAMGGQMMNTQIQGKLNINTCSEGELASLPGLNIIDAKKAISHRQQYGDFGSIEEFVVLLGLKPHIAAPLYDILYCEGSGAPQRMGGGDTQNSGRRNLDF